MSDRIETDAPIFVAGHRGMVGSAIVRRLEACGYRNVQTRTRQELDLRNQAAVHQFMEKLRPRYVFLAAARVGGILANSTQPAEFLYDNLAIQTNLLRAAHDAGVQRLLFLGSSCIYPRDCPQPIKESYLLTGPLESTNEAYAVAKIAGIKLCEAFNRQHGREYVSAMPTNLYGPNDNYDLTTSHVIPALIRKAHKAKQAGEAVMEVWGSGNPKREFLHVDDLAAACVFMMEHKLKKPLYNVGTGEDLSIRELAELVQEVVGFEGELAFDTSMPDGTPRKLLDVSRLSEAGWRARISLRDGLEATYRDYLERGGRHQAPRQAIG